MKFLKPIVQLYRRLKLSLEFPEKKQIDYLLDLGAWVADGIKPTDAVEAMIAINAANNKPYCVNSRVSESIYSALDSGKEIHHGMVGYFNEHLITIFKSAGSTGLDVTLKSLKEDTEQLKQLRGKFFKPLFLPLIYSLVLFGSCVQIATIALPAVSKGKPIHHWPSEAQSFYIAVNAVLEYWPYALMVFIAAFYYSSFFLRNNVSKFRMEIDSMIGLNLYRVYNGNLFLKSLSVLLMSKMNLVDALETIESNSSRYLSWHAAKAKQSLTEGVEDLGDILDTGLITGDVLIRMRFLTATDSHEAKIEGLRLTASRSIDMAGKKLQVGGYILAAFLTIGIVYSLISAFLALITLSMSR